MIVDRYEAPRLAARYRCSDCWGVLVIHPLKTDPEKSDVHCATEGCECHGFVTAGFVERRQQEERAEAVEARYLLHDVIHAGQPQKTEAELLKSLGF